jgi:hypothetical protein
MEQKMIISLDEVVSNTNITEDNSGRKVFRDVFTTQEILVNTDNIVSVRPADKLFWNKLDESKMSQELRGKQFSSVFLNKGGVNSTDIVVVGSPNEIMSKLNKRVLLND